MVLGVESVQREVRVRALVQGHVVAVPQQGILHLCQVERRLPHFAPLLSKSVPDQRQVAQGPHLTSLEKRDHESVERGDGRGTDRIGDNRGIGLRPRLKVQKQVEEGCPQLALVWD